MGQHIARAEAIDTVTLMVTVETVEGDHIPWQYDGVCLDSIAVTASGALTWSDVTGQHGLNDMIWVSYETRRSRHDRPRRNRSTMQRSNEGAVGGQV